MSISQKNYSMDSGYHLILQPLFYINNNTIDGTISIIDIILSIGKENKNTNIS